MKGTGQILDSARVAPQHRENPVPRADTSAISEIVTGFCHVSTFPDIKGPKELRLVDIDNIVNHYQYKHKNYCVYFGNIVSLISVSFTVT